MAEFVRVRDLQSGPTLQPGSDQRSVAGNVNALRGAQLCGLLPAAPGAQANAWALPCLELFYFSIIIL